MNEPATTTSGPRKSARWARRLGIWAFIAQVVSDLFWPLASGAAATAFPLAASTGGAKDEGWLATRLPSPETLQDSSWVE